MVDILDVENLYRFPWSKNDHPSGYIETTTYCNMSCPGCYRGCNSESNKKEHKSFEKIKEEILLFKKIRNCQTIALTGGEPLLHPDILKIFGFIKKSGMKVLLVTNGKMLTRSLLLKLKEAGLDGINIRVDSIRSPEKGFSEKDMNELRDKLTSLVDGVGEIVLSFNYVVDVNNLGEVGDALEWFYRNSNKVDVFIFILKRQVFAENDEIDKSCSVMPGDLAKVILNKYHDFKYSAYLGSLSNDMRIKWLWAFPFFVGGEMIGYANRKLPEFLEMDYHYKNDRYFYILDKKDYSFGVFTALALLLKTKDVKLLKNLLKKILFNPFTFFKKCFLRQVIMINPPSFVDGKRDICDAGPCCTIYDGKVEPSCVLEEIKKFGKTYELKSVKYKKK